MADEKNYVQHHTRRRVQVLSALAQNARLKGFVTGTIYQGPLKNFCLPGLNCYSCPASVGACPIGALQAALGSKRKFPFYVLGFLTLIGVLLGRFVCGWLCLFGLVQELLYRIPSKKLTVPPKLDRVLRFGKYLMLFGVVIVLSGFLRAENGLVSVPYFCKYVCPAGMLEGGIPLVALNAPLRDAIGWQYAWKGLVLALTILSSILIYRPFCKYICPLGAFYGLFQRVSFLHLNLKKEKCVGCGACVKSCPMQVDVLHSPNSPECIRCGECVKTCPQSALSFNVPEVKHRGALIAALAVLILALVLYVNLAG